MFVEIISVVTRCVTLLIRQKRFRLISQKLFKMLPIFLSSIKLVRHAINHTTSACIFHRTIHTSDFCCTRGFQQKNLVASSRIRLAQTYSSSENPVKRTTTRVPFCVTFPRVTDVNLVLLYTHNSL